jgi:hypothetical protein
VFTLAPAHGIGVAKDAVRRALAQLQSKGIDKARGAKAGCLFSRRNDGFLFFLGRAVGTVVRVLRVVGQRMIPVLVAVKPQAHGVARTLKVAWRGVDAVGKGVMDQGVALAEFVLTDFVHAFAEFDCVGVGVVGLHTSASIAPLPPLFPMLVIRSCLPRSSVGQHAWDIVRIYGKIMLPFRKNGKQYLQLKFSAFEYR